MGDPVTIGLMVASTMLTAKAQRAQGEALAQQASFERQQAEEQAEMARIRGIDDEAERRKDFARHAATERAFTAAAGVRNFLGSPQRLQDEARTQLGRDITKIKLNTATFRRDAQITGAAAASRAAHASSAGTMRALGTAAQGALRIHQLKEPKKE